MKHEDHQDDRCDWQIYQEKAVPPRETLRQPTAVVTGRPPRLQRRSRTRARSLARALRIDPWCICDDRRQTSGRRECPTYALHAAGRDPAISMLPESAQASDESANNATPTAKHQAWARKGYRAAFRPTESTPRGRARWPSIIPTAFGRSEQRAAHAEGWAGPTLTAVLSMKVIAEPSIAVKRTHAVFTGPPFRLAVPTPTISSGSSTRA